MGRRFLRMLLLMSLLGFPAVANSEGPSVSPIQPIGNYSIPYEYSFQEISVLENLRINHKVVTGFVCQTRNDIVCIDGVCNEPGIAYWAIYVNGDYLHYNAESLIRPSDHLQVKFQPVGVFQEGI